MENYWHIIVAALVIAAYIVVMRWILPRFGVPT